MSYDGPKPKFCGGAYKVDGQYGEYFTIYFSQADLKLMLEESDHRGVKVSMNAKRTQTEGSTTHYLKVLERRETSTTPVKPVEQERDISSLYTPQFLDTNAAVASKMLDDIDDDIPF